MKKLISILIMAAILVLMTAQVYATSPDLTPATDAAVVTETDTVDKPEAPEVQDANDTDDIINEAFVAEVTTYFGIDPVAYSNIDLTTMEAGELFFCSYFAEQSGKTPEEIQTMKIAGDGWGKMSKDMGLAPGSHGRAMGNFRSGK